MLFTGSLHFLNKCNILTLQREFSEIFKSHHTFASSTFQRGVLDEKTTTVRFFGTPCIKFYHSEGALANKFLFVCLLGDHLSSQ